MNLYVKGSQITMACYYPVFCPRLPTKNDCVLLFHCLWVVRHSTADSVPFVSLAWGQQNPGAPVVYHEEGETGLEPSQPLQRLPMSHRNHLHPGEIVQKVSNTPCYVHIKWQTSEDTEVRENMGEMCTVKETTDTQMNQYQSKTSEHEINVCLNVQHEHFLLGFKSHSFHTRCFREAGRCLLCRWTALLAIIWKRHFLQFRYQPLADAFSQVGFLCGWLMFKDVWADDRDVWESAGTALSLQSVPGATEGYCSFMSFIYWASGTCS